MSMSKCCDICNKKIEDKCTHSFELRINFDIEDNINSEWVNKDLCKDCYHSMINYIKSKSKVNNNKLDIDENYLIETVDNRNKFEKWLEKVFN